MTKDAVFDETAEVDWKELDQVTLRKPRAAGQGVSTAPGAWYSEELAAHFRTIGDTERAEKGLPPLPRDAFGAPSPEDRSELPLRRQGNPESVERALRRCERREIMLMIGRMKKMLARPNLGAALRRELEDRIADDQRYLAQGGYTEWDIREINQRIGILKGESPPGPKPRGGLGTSSRSTPINRQRKSRCRNQKSK
jgi:hypothetical protein